jgi:mTERF
MAGSRDLSCFCSSYEIRPTVDVLKSFGFRLEDVKRMVESCPSILALNHEWTIPEKLMTLEKVYHLDRNELVHVVTNAPFAMSYSIENHFQRAAFLSDTVGMTRKWI